MNNLQPGVKTSEFGIAFAGIILGALVMTGLLSSEFASSVQPGLELIVGGIISVVSGVTYIVKRADLKKTALTQSEPTVPYTVQETPESEAEVTFPLPEGTVTTNP